MEKQYASDAQDEDGPPFAAAQNEVGPPAATQDEAGHPASAQDDADPPAAAQDDADPRHPPAAAQEEDGCHTVTQVKFTSLQFLSFTNTIFLNKEIFLNA